MNMLFWVVLMTGTLGASEAKSSQPNETPIADDKHAVDIIPDAELLLFLAEWNEQLDGQWVEPEVFSGQNALSEELEKQAIEQNNEQPEQKTDESKPDNI